MPRQKNSNPNKKFYVYLDTGDFMKKVPTATCALKDR